MNNRIGPWPFLASSIGRPDQGNMNLVIHIPGTSSGRKPGVNHTLPVTSAWRVGIAHVVCGIIVVLCGGAAMYVTHSDSGMDRVSGVGTGYWCGGMFIVTAIFAFLSADRRTNELITSLMVFSVLSGFFFAPILIGIACRDLIYRWRLCPDLNSVNVIDDCRIADTMVALNSVFLIAAFLEIAFAYWSIAIGYAALSNTNAFNACCGSCQCCEDTTVTVTSDPRRRIHINYEGSNTQLPSNINRGVVASLAHLQSQMQQQQEPRMQQQLQQLQQMQQLQQLHVESQQPEQQQPQVQQQAPSLLMQQSEGPPLLFSPD